MSERGRSIWDLAEKAQAEVDKWPEWKRRAADMALVTRPAPEQAQNPSSGSSEETQPRFCFGSMFQIDLDAFLKEPDINLVLHGALLRAQLKARTRLLDSDDVEEFVKRIRLFVPLLKQHGLDTRLLVITMTGGGVPNSYKGVAETSTLTLVDDVVHVSRGVARRCPGGEGIKLTVKYNGKSHESGTQLLKKLGASYRGGHLFMDSIYDEIHGESVL